MCFEAEFAVWSLQVQTRQALAGIRIPSGLNINHGQRDRIAIEKVRRHRC